MENKIITFPCGQSAAIFLLSSLVLLQSTFRHENSFSSSCNLENLSMNLIYFIFIILLGDFLDVTLVNVTLGNMSL